MIIAERILKCRLNNMNIDVPIRIHIPEFESIKVFKCVYEIHWPDGVYIDQGWGVDSVQALELCMKSIAQKLYFSDYHKDGALFWPGQGLGYGFPIAKNGRDLLVGQDKEFDG